MITVSHPWHGVPPGELSPRVVNAVIEIPQGSRAKYEIDKDSGLLKAAYATAKDLSDDSDKAKALLDLIDKIDAAS